MSNKDANVGATPTRQSTSVQSASSSMSGATPRHSLLPSPDTSAMIIDDLAYDSGSDDEMSIEAKRVLRRKKLEREKLQKLGKLIPIETENEPEIIKLAESHSEAYALPMRPKEEVSNLTELSKRSSMIRSSILTHVTESEVSRRQSIISEECRPRKSKAVGFGLVEETQFDKLPQENEEVIQQSASDSTTGGAGTSGMSRSPPSRSPPGRRRSTRSSSVLPDENTTERSSEEDTRLAESFTALRNALQDDKNKSL